MPSESSSPLKPPLKDAPFGWRGRWRGFRTLMAFSFQADPPLFIRLFAFETFGGLAGLAATYGIKLLTDAAVHAQLGGVIAAATLIAVCRSVGAIFGQGYVNSSIQVEEKATHLLDKRLMAITSGLFGLEHHERPDYVDELGLLRGDRRLIGQMANATVLNLRIAIQFFGGAFLLAHLHPLLLLVPLSGLGPFYASGKSNELSERAREANTERGRTRSHLFTLSTSAGSGKELRLFGLGDELIARHHRVSDEMLRQTQRAVWQGTALNVAGALVFAAGYGGAITLVLLRAMRGLATAGDVMLALTLAAQMNYTITTAVRMGDYVMRAMRATRRYFWLLDYAAAAQLPSDQPAAVPSHLAHGIDLDHVSFRYPETDKLILDDVTLHLPAGAVVALVGENGAGKTTLVKLLCRFYDPTTGRVDVDGIDLRRFIPEAWRERTTAAFQDFRQFQFLARETVGLGSLPLIDEPAAVRGALVRAGADDVMASLPAGLETQLGKDWEGGVDLSGGQWQKLALARAFMREQPLLVVFDEPTAALDAQTEHALFERLAAAARSGASRGTVTVIVSHRFSSVRMADLIVVIDKGRAVEVGSHEDLMRRRGLYAELYELQAAAYR